jgi:hypothetical protein
MSAGVALAGATAIAISPISPVAPALPDITMPATTAAKVELTSIQDGIAAYFDLFRDTTDSLVNLFNAAVIENGPAPILQAIIENQLGLAAGLADGFQGSVDAVLQQIANFPTVVEVVSGLLASGNVLGAATTFVDAINIGAILTIAPLLDPVVAAITTPINHFADAVTAVASQGLLLAGLALLSAPSALIVSGGAAAQGIVDAFESGDIGDIIGSFIAAPAVVANGVLNGFTANYPGLLSEFGPFGALIQIRDIIADAISPNINLAPFSAGPASVPDTGRMVSFTTGDGAQGGGETTGGGDGTQGADNTSGDDLTGGDDATGDDMTGDDGTGGDDATGDGDMTGGDEGTGGDDLTGGDEDTGGDDLNGADNTGDNENTGGDDATGDGDLTGGDEGTGDTDNAGDNDNDNAGDSDNDNDNAGDTVNTGGGAENTGGTEQ